MKTTHLHLFLFILFLGCTSSLTAQYKWFNPQKESFPVVRGQAWQEDPAGFYTRLPQRAKDKVRKAVWDLSLQSAGLSIAFRSNAPEIKIRYVVKGALSMPHMPATGVSGIDLYATDNNGQERWCVGRYVMQDTITYDFSGLSYAAKTGKGAADAGADACFKKFMGNRRGRSKGEDSFLTLQDRNKSIQSRPFSMFVSDGDRKRFFI